MRMFNVGIGRGYSVKEVIESAECVVGRGIATRIEARRPGDAPALVAGDTEKTKAALGWRPRFADIERILADAWRWQQALEKKRGGSR